LPEPADGPFTRLRVLTPRLSLEPIDDAMARRLAGLASRGVHHPDTMPFAFPWTDAPAHELEANTVEFHRGNRADLQPHRWAVNFAVVADGALVGSTGLGAEAFPASRRFETGSWLGLEFQGRGLGKEMRLDTSLAFEMTADDFRARLRRDDIRLEGVQECLPLLGLA
jgi:RimJ/RimL family protein N-acetyltransferase